MKYLMIIGCFAFLSSCGNKTYHTVSVKKPIYHHTWYVKSKWHRKSLGPVRYHLHLFEKQGARNVKMRG